MSENGDQDKEPAVTDPVADAWEEIQRALRPRGLGLYIVNTRDAEIENTRRGFIYHAPEQRIEIRPVQEQGDG